MLIGWEIKRDEEGFYASRRISFWQKRYFLSRGCQVSSSYYNGSWFGTHWAAKIDWYDITPRGAA